MRIKTKKILSLALSVLMLFSIMQMCGDGFEAKAYTVESGGGGLGGDCGDKMSWIYSDYLLEVNGSGEMYNFEEGTSPFSGLLPQMTELDIGDDVESIGNYAFYQCYMLSNVYLGKGLKYIGDYAFASCTDLESIKLPAYLETIGNYAFYRSTLKKIDASKSLYFSNDDTGVLFNNNKTLLIWYPGGVESDTYTIPYTVTDIGVAAFARRTNLLNITIPYGVLNIEEKAFENCSGLKQLVLPASVINIGVEAFRGCTDVSNVVIPDSVETIGAGAFKGCKNIIEISMPDSVTNIDEQTFYGCESLTEITIGSDIKSIGYAAFHNCNNLTDVYFNGTKKQWDSISIESLNNVLLNANIHFTGCSHENIKIYEQKDATCTEDGYTKGEYCLDCEMWVSGHNDIPALNPTGHTYKKVVTVPTCTAQGYTTYTCECGDSYVSDYTDMIEHSYTSEITTPATHLTEGVETFSCACGETYEESIAKLEGHTYTSKITKESSHLEEGMITYTCICGDNYTESIGKVTEHSYKKVVTAPTCTEKGYTTYTCVCGDSYISDYVGTKSHSYTSTVTRPATHLTEGIKTYTCSGCGDTYIGSIAKATEHTYTVSYVVEPTCEKEGYTVYSCQCGDSYQSDVEAKTGHNYDSTTCRNCGESKVDNCSCNCHKKGFMRIIWKIINFFYKLFKINPVCSCGIAHY